MWTRTKKGPRPEACNPCDLQAYIRPVTAALLLVLLQSIVPGSNVDIVVQQAAEGVG